MRSLSRCAASLAFCICISVHTGETTLFDDGKCGCFIAIAQDAGPVAKEAAAILQANLGRACGRETEIIEIPVKPTATLKEFANGRKAILVGDSQYVRQAGLTPGELPPDGFLLKTIPDGLVIAGNDGKSFSWNYDWTPESAGTLYGVHRFLETLGFRWYLPATAGEITPAKPTLRIPEMNVTDAPYFEYRFGGYNSYKWRRAIGYGGTVDPWSSRHTFTVTVDFSRKYGKSHPEYLSQGGGAIALRHPGVAEAVVAEATAFLSDPKRPGGKKYFAVNPTDAWPGCGCPLCQSLETPQRGSQGVLSDYVGGAVVDVAARLRAAGAAGSVVYCAYDRYWLPPLGIDRLPGNVVVLLSAGRGPFYDATQRERTWAAVGQWGKLQPRRLYFCRYSHHDLKLTPSFMPHLIDKDIKRMKAVRESGRAAVGGEMDYGFLPDGHPYIWWFGLNEYVRAKLLWNPDLDVDAVLDDFYMKSFGPSASIPMKRFFTRLEELYMDDKERQVYELESLDLLDSLLKEAASIANGSGYASRIGYFDKGFDTVRGIRRKHESSYRGERMDGLAASVSGDSLPLKDELSGRTLESSGATLTKGVKGMAVELSGDGSFVRLPEFLLSGCDYSIEMWIKPANTPSSGRQYLFGCDSWDKQILCVEDGGALVLQHRIPAANYAGSIIRLAAPDVNIKTGAWSHVAATFSRSGGIALYMNGKLCAMDPVLNKAPEFTAIAYLLGACGNSRITDMKGFWKGAIDEVRIYKRELSLKEISESFNEFADKAK